uniref:Uncharacterized protein n=1 Tax=Steinernema glaseri TaxID=37863 RepID=A0A1I7YDQ3_9BILA
MGFALCFGTTDGHGYLTREVTEGTEVVHRRCCDVHSRCVPTVMGEVRRGGSQRERAKGKVGRCAKRRRLCKQALLDVVVVGCGGGRCRSRRCRYRTRSVAAAAPSRRPLAVGERREVVGDARQGVPCKSVAWRFASQAAPRSQVHLHRRCALLDQLDVIVCSSPSALAAVSETIKSGCCDRAARGLELARLRCKKRRQRSARRGKPNATRPPPPPPLPKYVICSQRVQAAVPPRASYSPRQSAASSCTTIILPLPFFSPRVARATPGVLQTPLSDGDHERMVKKG